MKKIDRLDVFERIDRLSVAASERGDCIHILLRKTDALLRKHNLNPGEANEICNSMEILIRYYGEGNLQEGCER